MKNAKRTKRNKRLLMRTSETLREESSCSNKQKINCSDKDSNSRKMSGKEYNKIGKEIEIDKDRKTVR